MPRKPVEVSDKFPYHIMNRSNNGDWFAVSPDECWNIFCDFLYLICAQYQIEVHLFVLMSNHYHLLASTPHANVSVAVQRFQTEVAQAINRESGRTNHVFGGQYKPCLIKENRYLSNVFRYVARNPVKAGLSSTVEGYDYSTMSGELGRTQLVVPITQKYHDFMGPSWEERLAWLNEPVSEEEEDVVARALNRKVFHPPVSRTKRKPII